MHAFAKIKSCTISPPTEPTLEQNNSSYEWEKDIRHMLQSENQLKISHSSYEICNYLPILTPSNRTIWPAFTTKDFELYWNFLGGPSRMWFTNNNDESRLCKVSNNPFEESFMKIVPYDWGKTCTLGFEKAGKHFFIIQSTFDGYQVYQ